jgi:hypothetical protein
MEMNMDEGQNATSGTQITDEGKKEFERSRPPRGIILTT